MCLSVINRINYSEKISWPGFYSFSSSFLFPCLEKSSYIYLTFCISKNTLKPGCLSIYNKKKIFLLWGSMTKNEIIIKERSNIHMPL